MPPGLTSPFHLLVIVVVALVVLGPEKLPQALRHAGRTIAEVRRWSGSISSEMRDVLSLDVDDEAPAPAPASAVPAPTRLTPPAMTVPSALKAEEPDGQPSPHPALAEGGEWS